jgi:hypothetical protein
MLIYILHDERKRRVDKLGKKGREAMQTYLGRRKD